jgi:hypothetical protein
MTEVLNGQIVPALSQWQGAIGIVVAIGLDCAYRHLRKAFGLATQR